MLQEDVISHNSTKYIVYPEKLSSKEGNLP